MDDALVLCTAYKLLCLGKCQDPVHHFRFLQTELDKRSHATAH